MENNKDKGKDSTKYDIGAFLLCVARTDMHAS